MGKRIRTHVNPLSILKEISFEGFDNKNPIWIDVGACRGEFSQSLIKQFPDKNFLLFEIRAPLFKRLEKVFEGHKNVRVFDGDAGRNFRKIVEPILKKGICIEKIFVNFPDPWFKEKHKKRRFITESFLQECGEYLDDQTEFFFQTDQKFLFEETMEMVKKSAFSKIDLLDSSPFEIKTHWEEVKLHENPEIKIWRMKFKKSG